MSGNEINITLDGRKMEEVITYRYLGVDVLTHGRTN